MNHTTTKLSALLLLALMAGCQTTYTDYTAFVRDPQSFRYTSMPANPHLSDADLDALVAYFRAMSQRKRDPRPAAAQ